MKKATDKLNVVYDMPELEELSSTDSNDVKVKSNISVGDNETVSTFSISEYSNNVGDIDCNIIADNSGSVYTSSEVCSLFDEENSLYDSMVVDSVVNVIDDQCNESFQRVPKRPRYDKPAPVTSTTSSIVSSSVIAKAKCLKRKRDTKPAGSFVYDCLYEKLTDSNEKKRKYNKNGSNYVNKCKVDTITMTDLRSYHDNIAFRAYTPDSNSDSSFADDSERDASSSLDSAWKYRPVKRNCKTTSKLKVPKKKLKLKSKLKSSKVKHAIPMRTLNKTDKATLISKNTSFLNQIRKECSDEPYIYEDFLRLLIQWKSGWLSDADIVKKTDILLVDYDIIRMQFKQLIMSSTVSHNIDVNNIAKLGSIPSVGSVKSNPVIIVDHNHNNSMVDGNHDSVINEDMHSVNECALQSSRSGISVALNSCDMKVVSHSSNDSNSTDTQPLWPISQRKQSLNKSSDSVSLAHKSTTSMKVSPQHIWTAVNVGTTRSKNSSVIGTQQQDTRPRRPIIDLT